MGVYKIGGLEFSVLLEETRVGDSVRRLAAVSGPGTSSQQFLIGKTSSAGC